MIGLAVSLSQQGRYADAEAMDRQTLQLKESALGKDYTLPRSNLASSLHQPGRCGRNELYHL
jgi:hypothetical protein